MPNLNAKAVERAVAGRHSDGQGLYLLVSETGAKSWVLRIQVAGRRRDLGLGSTSQLSLAEARDKSRELRKAAKSGADPIAHRDKEKAHIPSFQAAVVACHAARQRGWAPRHADAFLAMLKLHAFPRIGSLRVDSVDEKDIVAVLSPLWHDRPAAARKLRQRINTVLDYAKGSGWRSAGAPRDGLRPLLSKQAKGGNFPSMPYEHVPEYYQAVRDQSPTMGRRGLLFVILTAARSGEVRSARWSQLDIDAGTWTRPAGMMKGGDEHTVTLSTPALRLLKEAHAFRADKDDELVFPGTGGRPLSDMTLLKIVKAHGGGFSVHGFRSSFRTWAAEQMPLIPEAVAEAALAHAVPDAVVRAYQRAKFIQLRKQLLEYWGAFLEGNSELHSSSS